MKVVNIIKNNKLFEEFFDDIETDDIQIDTQDDEYEHSMKFSFRTTSDPCNGFDEKQINKYKALFNNVWFLLDTAVFAERYKLYFEIEYTDIKDEEDSSKFKTITKQFECNDIQSIIDYSRKIISARQELWNDSELYTWNWYEDNIDLIYFSFCIDFNIVNKDMSWNRFAGSVFKIANVLNRLDNNKLFYIGDNVFYMFLDGKKYDLQLTDTIGRFLAVSSFSYSLNQLKNWFEKNYHPVETKTTSDIERLGFDRKHYYSNIIKNVRCSNYKKQLLRLGTLKHFGDFNIDDVYISTNMSVKITMSYIGPDKKVKASDIFKLIEQEYISKFDKNDEKEFKKGIGHKLELILNFRNFDLRNITKDVLIPRYKNCMLILQSGNSEFSWNTIE